MARPILPQSHPPFPKGVPKGNLEQLLPPLPGAGNEPQSQPDSHNGSDYAVAKAGSVYYVCTTTQPSMAFQVTKSNGRIVCSCSGFRQAPHHPCEHIREVIRHVKSPQNLPPSNGPSKQTAAKTPTSRPPLPEIAKPGLTWLLEYPFRPDQIKLKNGLEYIDGAAVIQRLNDVLGTGNWSFHLLGQPLYLEDEVLVRGQLIATIDGKKVIKEDFGAHEYAATSRNGQPFYHSDTIKAAVTDCIKRCAHQLGVGLHLYSRDGTFRSFRITGILN